MNAYFATDCDAILSTLMNGNSWTKSVEGDMDDSIKDLSTFTQRKCEEFLQKLMSKWVSRFQGWLLPWKLIAIKYQVLVI